MTKYSLDKDKIKVLLLEGVHPNSVDNFKSAGYTNVEYVKHRNWFLSVVSVSAPTKLIWLQQKNAVFLYSTHHSLTLAA
jgi:hypothetical protein